VPFITIWETNSTDNNITIYINDDHKDDYNYTVNWGDGQIENNITTKMTHTYASEGNHTVKISGEFPAMRTILRNVSSSTLSQLDEGRRNNAKQLQAVTQWGDIKWSSFYNAFAACSNMDITAIDTPSSSDVTTTKGMFWNASNLKGNKYFNDWDVSSVTNMSSMFKVAKSFNQPLNDWDVSNVNNMFTIFTEATNFNQALNDWDVSNVIDMDSMFYKATNFNQPLNDWNVSSVTNMASMFYKATNFNQPLNNWDVSSVTNMFSMFYNASSFKNQDLSTWNVKSGVGHFLFMDGGTGNTEPNWN
jgi:surface protein